MTVGTHILPDADLATVFSMEDVSHHQWQAELLAHTFTKSRQPGSLTALISTNLPQPDRTYACHNFVTKNYFVHPRSGDMFHCYNKPFALRDWLSTGSVNASTLLILDPDFVISRPVLRVPQPGAPIGQDWRPDFAAKDGLSSMDLLVRRHCRRYQDLIALVGVPLFIARSDMEAVLDRWIEVTEQIRDDQVSRAAAGWLAEMWGYIIASAELGLRHKVEWMAQTLSHDRGDLPMVHYTGHYQFFNKQDYQPWADPGPLSPEAPPSCRPFWESLNDYRKVVAEAGSAIGPSLTADLRDSKALAHSRSPSAP